MMQRPCDRMLAPAGFAPHVESFSTICNLPMSCAQPAPTPLRAAAPAQQLESGGTDLGHAHRAAGPIAAYRAAQEPRAAPGSRLSPAGGIAFSGLDLSQPLSAAAIARIRAAFREYHFVVFREQRLSREQQFAFASYFGEVERGAEAKHRGKRDGVAHVISNLGADGRPADRSASAVSNYNWHTDKPYYRVPPMMTALYAVELPSRGGDTEFANTALAYSALSAQVQRHLAGLRVVFYWGAGARPSLEGSEILRAVDHPLVRTHPQTGAKALYIGNHSSHILGWPVPAGKSLLNRLLAHATGPEFVYSHQWQPGDLVMWDNRCLLHRAVANFDLSKERRVMHRIVVRGTVPF